MECPLAAGAAAVAALPAKAPCILRRWVLPAAAAAGLQLAAAPVPPSCAQEDILAQIPRFGDARGGMRKMKPETGVKRTDLQFFESEPAGPDGMREVAAEVRASSGTRVLITFSSPWPSSSGIGSSGISVRAKQGSESAFVQVVPNVGSQTAADLDPSTVLDAVLSPKGKFGGNGPPENVKILSSELRSSAQPGGRSYLTVAARFTALTPRVVQVETRAILAATVVAGDAFVLVGSCREALWKKSARLLTATVESFSARAA